MMLRTFLTEHHDELVARSKAKVALRKSPSVTKHEVRNGVPLFLRQLHDALSIEENAFEASDEAISASATQHGQALLKMGFTIGQVVHDYGDVCQSVIDLVKELKVEITTQEFRTMNRCLDVAIAGAVTEFERRSVRSVTALDNERLGFLAHELRNKLTSATLSYQALQKGRVGIGGSTGDLLGRSLVGLSLLIEEAICKVRGTTTSMQSENIYLTEFIEETEVSANMRAANREIDFRVRPIPSEIHFTGNRGMLAAVIDNLLDNAFKFTHPHSTVFLSTLVEGDRVLISIEDECGGLQTQNPEELFQSFEQRSNDRSGLGLGLSICRRNMRSSGGDLHARNVPGAGCVFTIDAGPLAKEPAVN